MIHPLFFYTLAALSLAGALGVVLARRPVYSVLNLVVTLFGLSALFVVLRAPFVALIQILVYAGAIGVLFLFVVMLLGASPDALTRGRGKLSMLTGGVLSLFFLFCLAKALCPAVAASPVGETAVVGSAAAIGLSLFTTYALPFEAASILLLAGIVGAIVLAKKRL